MRADAAHLVVQAFALPLQNAFDPQRREFVRNHSQGPLIGGVAIGEHFGGSLVLAASAELAVPVTGDDGDAQELAGPANGIGGDDYPAPGDGIFANFGQTMSLPCPAAQDPMASRKCSILGGFENTTLTTSKRTFCQETPACREYSRAARRRFRFFSALMARSGEPYASVSRDFTS